MPKGEENRSVRFSSPRGTPHLSTDRASPPRINARGLTDTITQRDSRDTGQRPEECSRFAPEALMFSIASRKFPRR